MWSTATRGLPLASDSPLAYETPTSSDPISPGRQVTASASTFARGQPAAASPRETTASIHSMCILEAISGTTPANGRCASTWDATSLDRMAVPSRTTAAAHSSHDVSIPRMRRQVTAATAQKDVQARTPPAQFRGAGAPARRAPRDWSRDR